MKASVTMCIDVLSLRSQFFHSLRHFSSHPKLRSTTHRLGIILKVWSSLRLAIVTLHPSISWTFVAKDSPVYPPSASTFFTWVRLFLCNSKACNAPFLSVSLAVVIWSECGSPWLSTAIWRLMPDILAPPPFGSCPHRSLFLLPYPYFSRFGYL
jgi:hypothetical protein